ncbi:unnamed protein product [Diplocarpon coronariae]
MPYNCSNWARVNKSPCACSDGRDSDMAMPGAFCVSREIYVPKFENGTLYYTIRAIIAASDFYSGWIIEPPVTVMFLSNIEPPARTAAMQ